MAEQPTVDPEKGTSAGTDKTRLVQKQGNINDIIEVHLSI